MPREIEIVPFAQNGLSSDYLFTQRKYYAEDPNIYLLEKNSSKPIDMWYERPLWGKVDPKQRVIFPFDGALKPIGNNLLAINFVADAYTDFKRFVLQAKETFRSSVGSFINVDNPVKAYEDCYTRYQEYFTEELQPVFMNGFLNIQRRKEINNFLDFSNNYLYYVDTNLSLPHTLAGYILSPKMSYRNSGLIIEFADDKPDKDSIKWTKYLSNDFFQDYIKIAAAHGFYINKNVPWSITANLNSNRLKQYMENYAIDNASDVFENYYFQAEEISYYLYKKLMILSYLTLITSGISTEEVIEYHNCMRSGIENSSFKTKISFRQKLFELGDIGAYPVEALTKVYSEETYFNYYINIRLKEEAVMLDKQQMKVLKNKLMDVLNKKDISSACLSLSNYLAKVRSKRFKDLTDKKFSLKIPK